MQYKAHILEHLAATSTTVAHFKQWILASYSMSRRLRVTWLVFSEMGEKG